MVDNNGEINIDDSKNENIQENDDKPFVNLENIDNIPKINNDNEKNEIEQNKLIKVKNLFCTILYNVRMLLKTDFEEDKISNIINILQELKKLMRSSNNLINVTFPSQWYIDNLIDYLDKIQSQIQKNIKGNEGELKDQIEILFQKRDQIFSRPENQVQRIKKYIDDMKEHINEIEKKYKSFIEQKEYYDYITKEFIEYLDITDCISYQSAITDPKANKERFDPSMNKNIQVDAKGMVNYQSLMEDGTKVELENLIKKWTVLQQEYEKLSFIMD